METIRPYRPSDRAGVRQLAYDTADAGAPSTFPAPALQMDLLTRYYTDHEPGSLWILEKDRKVAGYLTGCLDTKKFLAWLRGRGNALTALHVIRNFHRPAIWTWAHARMRTLREGGAHRETWVSDFPAHLHLNLAKDARGAGWGVKLIETFLQQCRAAQVKGVHLATRGNNAAAKRFFERNGFAPLADINAYRPTTHGLESVPVLIMGRAL